MTTSYTPEDLAGLRDEYRSALLEDTLPFWFPRAIDEEHGGYLIPRDRDGTLVDDDKSVWQQGRVAWMLATLHNAVEPREEWRQGALSGLQFLRDHCYDREGDGRMFFHMTREGVPLRKRRYTFSECFACLGFAAYAKAANDGRAAEEAVELFQRIVHFADHPEELPAKFTGNRPAKGLGGPMILLNVAQQLRETIGFDQADSHIDRCISEIRNDFVKPDLECVMEQVAPDGSIIDHFDGRTLNPGHAIEGRLVHPARGHASR